MWGTPLIIALNAMIPVGKSPNNNLSDLGGALMTTYAGIDLHSNNIYLGVIDHASKRIFNKRLPNKLAIIKKALQPFKTTLAGIAVESTFNWYWLVDGLQQLGYRMHLANPAAIRQYGGIKHSDDKSQDRK